MHAQVPGAHAHAHMQWTCTCICNTRVRKSGCSQSLQPHVLLPSSTPCAPTRAAADGVLVLVLKPPRPSRVVAVAPRAQAHRRAGTEESVRLNTQPKSTQARLTLIKLDTYVWVATKYCMGSRLQRRWASEDKAVELLSCITIVSRAMSPEERPSRGVLTLPAAGNAPAVRPMISTEECPLGKAETARRPLSRLGVGAAARHD